METEKTRGMAVASAFPTVLWMVNVEAVSHFASALCITLSNCRDVQWEVLTDRLRYKEMERNEIPKELSQIIGNKRNNTKLDFSLENNVVKGAANGSDVLHTQLSAHTSTQLIRFTCLRRINLHFTPGMVQKTCLCFSWTRQSTVTTRGLAEAKFVALWRFQIIYSFINIFWNWLCASWRYFLPWLGTNWRAWSERKK